MNVAKKSEKHPFSLFPPRRSWPDSLSLSLTRALSALRFPLVDTRLTSPLNLPRRLSPPRRPPTRRFSPLPALPLSTNPSRRVQTRLPLAKSPVFVFFSFGRTECQIPTWKNNAFKRENVSPRIHSKRHSSPLFFSIEFFDNESSRYRYDKKAALIRNARIKN